MCRKPPDSRAEPRPSPSPRPRRRLSRRGSLCRSAGILPALSLGRSRRDAGAPSEVCGESEASPKLARAGGTPALRKRFAEWTSGLPDDSRAWIDHAWTRYGLDDLRGSVYRPACHCWWGGEVGVGGVSSSQEGFSHRGSFCRSAGILPALSLGRSRRYAGAPSEVCGANLRPPRSSPKPAGRRRSVRGLWGI